ncbi:MAG: hypothetical protein PHV39_03065 [Methanomicrobium sp.]|nr:hypothetical protein [Methanomicrobium sp.]
MTNCHGLKMPAPDGKMRITYVADTEQLISLIPEFLILNVPENFEFTSGNKTP